MLPGETEGFQKEIKCNDCGEMMSLQVCRSTAGTYLGYYCGNCGPYSRETGYYRSTERAEKDLKDFLEKDLVPASLR